MAPADGGSSTSGFSELGEQFVAGQLHAARQLAWCFAPYVNSYRRYVPDSWAPTAVVWGEDNRTCGFRAVGLRREPADREPHSRSGREPLRRARRGHRRQASAGSTTSSSSRRPSPGTPTRRARWPAFPPSLAEALAELETSEVAAEAFGPDVHHHLVNTARQEWAASNRVVTDWELARNFERI